MKLTKGINRLSTCGLIFISFCCLLYINYINRTFWYDEAYTIAIMKHSFSEIWKITATDVHPPLYYFMLKLFIGIFGDSLFIMRMFSNLGVMASCLLGIFPIRRLFGEKVMFSFVLLMILMPVNQYLGVEIRMYSWAMFFVLACAVYAYEVFQKETLFCYSKMTFFGICAAYTHYYALIAVFSIFLILTIYLLNKKRTVVRPILFSIIFLLAYSPWVPILTTQFYSVHENFWVETPTLKDILLFSYYFFSPKEPSHPYTIFSIWTMSAALLIMLGLVFTLTIIIIRMHIQDKSNKRLRAGAYFILVFVSTIMITFAITFLIKPISVPRYTSCMLGALILGIAIYGVELYKTKAKPIVISGLILLSMLSIARFFSEKAYSISQNKKFTEVAAFVESKDKSLKMIAPLEAYPTLAELSVLLPKKEFLLFSPDDNTTYLPFEIKTIEMLPNISEFFFVQTANDSTVIPGKYRIKSKLQLDKIIISQIEAKNSN